MAILKICSYPGCTRIVGNTVRYCTYHEGKHNKEQKKRYKEYKNKRLHDKEQLRFQNFYNSDAWKRIRLLAIQDTLAIDVIDY